MAGISKWNWALPNFYPHIYKVVVDLTEHCTIVESPKIVDRRILCYQKR